jgi:hypothetical protein
MQDRRRLVGGAECDRTGRLSGGAQPQDAAGIAPPVLQKILVPVRMIP